MPLLAVLRTVLAAVWEVERRKARAVIQVTGSRGHGGEVHGSCRFWTERQDLLTDWQEEGGTRFL